MRQAKRCPYCGERMGQFFAMMTGGTWLCDSEEVLRRLVEAKRSADAAPPADNRGHPFICVVGASGCLHGSWPKEAFYCDKCGVLLVKVKPY